MLKSIFKKNTPINKAGNLILNIKKHRLQITFHKLTCI